MMILTVTQARELVSAFGVWPGGAHVFTVIPDPLMMWYIFPSLLEWRRN